mgnify:CR=1 FL=1
MCEYCALSGAVQQFEQRPVNGGGAVSACYGWVNVAKMEYLGNAPFACSAGIMENCRFPNDRTDAAPTLLAGRWHSGLVACVSDCTNPEALEGEGFRCIAELVPENPRDYI